MTPNREPPFSKSSLFAISLACRRCGKSEQHTVSRLFDLLSAKWPECCGEQMAVRLKLPWPESPRGGEGMALV